MKPRLEGSIVVLLLAAALASAGVHSSAAVPAWTSPNRYRVLLTVDPGGVIRHNSPASLNIDFPRALADLGASGTFDESTIEVFAYDPSGQPRPYDTTRSGHEKLLLPWRAQRYYGVSRLTLSFVVPDESCTQIGVYFDSVESGMGRPQRYPGIVGDGDWFTEGYKRREINASRFDDFCDFDGDGDLDFLKCGVEPFIEFYENVGGSRYVVRGPMTSNAAVFELPCSSDHRSWATVEFDDWDGDGDQDLFAGFSDGPDMGHVVRFENTTMHGGPIAFARVSDANQGRLMTVSGKPIGYIPFGSMTILDWDGDGKKDVLACRESMLEFHKNIGSDSSLADIQLADGVYLTANGQPISLAWFQVDCADIDTDGDLDLFAATEMGTVFWFENVGTRTSPVMRRGRLIVFYEGGARRSGVKVADFDGDGLLDIAAGCYWQGSHWGEQPTVFGRLYKNIGTDGQPRFEARDAHSGSPYTECFQIADATRQNGPRSVDWNNDGRTDLIVGDHNGFVWFFRNTTNSLFPIFEGQKLMAAGKPLKLPSGGEMWHGYSRVEICDWNNDGRKDLLVADTQSWLWLFLNQGTDAAPALGDGSRLAAEGVPIDGPGTRGSVLVCDWDADTRKDVVFADSTGYYFYKNIGTDASPSLGAGRLITFGGQGVDYTRPNLGSYLDWDLDGRRDLIACGFENDIRFYRNIGTGGSGTEPQFGDRNGVTIVRPYSIMVISGADARDWNNDGDVDIITGQGHGVSGLRLYERDYINDYVNNTYPIVTAGSAQEGVTLVQAKLLADGSSLNLPQETVTASFGDCFYVESQDRTAGIRVDKAGHGLSVGDRVAVSGSVTNDANGERCVAAASAIKVGSGNVTPLGMTAGALGGGDWPHGPGAGAGQQGTTGGVGLNNIGLLVRTWGRFTKTGATTFTLDDGSGSALNCVVQGDVTLDAGWTHAAVTGISSCETVGSGVRPLLRVRNRQDIAPL